MPRNPKLFIPNKPYFITSRTECGLPFIPTEFMNAIIKGILVSAANKYKVDICHYYWAPNHFHLIVVPRDLEALPKFIKYLKQESAHAVNRILGRKKRTIWCQSYDSPILLEPDEVLRRIAYLYTNPERDKIVDSIDNYTGVSSWKSFKNRNYKLVAKRIPRDCIPAQQEPTNITKLERLILCRIFKKLDIKAESLILKPYACLRCFKELEETTDKEFDEMIMGQMETHRQMIPKDIKPFHTKKTLSMMQIDLAYEPKKFGKKTIALSSDTKLRGEFISWFKSIRDKSREVYKKWKAFDFDEEWPLYLYPPPKPKRLYPVEFFTT